MTPLGYDFLKRVLTLAASHNIEGELLWATKEDGSLSFAINCSDCFFWGTADAEELTVENIGLLEQTLNECAALDDKCGEREYSASNYAGELFAARIRKMRPQGASYVAYPLVLWPLFDACGPERETGMGNPYDREKALEKHELNKQSYQPRGPSNQEMREQVAALNKKLESLERVVKKYREAADAVIQGAKPYIESAPDWPETQKRMQAITAPLSAAEQFEQEELRQPTP